MAMVLQAPNDMRLTPFAIPDIGPDAALLQVEMAGVCATDVKMLHGRLAVDYPVILGHEILGHIAAIGKRAADRYGCSIGDRVVIEGSIPCWSCLPCHTGNYRFCRRRSQYGAASSRLPPHLLGALATHMYVAPGSILHRIRKDVPAEAAVLATTVISNGIQWIRNLGDLRLQGAVVIQGAGPQGLAGVVAAREAGAAAIIITGLSKDAQRLELAKLYGAHLCIDVSAEDPITTVREYTGGDMADVVLDVTGSPQALQTSLGLLRPQGTLMLGGLAGKGVTATIEPDLLVWKEIRLQGAFTKGADAVDAAVRLIESRKYPLELMVTHTYPLDRALEAIQAAGNELAGLYPTKTAVVFD